MATPPFLITAEQNSDSHFRLAVRLRGLGLHHLATKIEDCGKRFHRSDKDRKFLPRWCRSKACPICATRLGKKTFAKHRERLAALMDQGGEAYFLTRTTPIGHLDEEAHARMIHLDIRGFTSDPWWKVKAQSTAVLTALEFGKESGLAHGHHLVAATTPHDASAVVEHLLSRWLRRHPEASLNAQDTCGPLKTVAAMEHWLSYITKGSRIDPDWSDDAILAAVALMSNGHQPITACGLARKARRPKPKQ